MIKVKDTAFEVSKNHGKCDVFDLAHDMILIGANGNGITEFDCEVNLKSRYNWAVDVFADKVDLFDFDKLELGMPNRGRRRITNRDQNPAEAIAMPSTRITVYFKSSGPLHPMLGFSLRLHKVSEHDCHSLIRIKNRSGPGQFTLPAADSNELRRCQWCVKGPSDQNIQFTFEDYDVKGEYFEDWIAISQKGYERYLPGSSDIYSSIVEPDGPIQSRKKFAKMCLLAYINNPNTAFTVKYEIV